MKRSTRNLALVAPKALTASAPAAPLTLNDKTRAAIDWLGERYCLHKDYRRRVRVGSVLTAFAADLERGRATKGVKS